MLTLLRILWSTFAFWVKKAAVIGLLIWTMVLKTHLTGANVVGLPNLERRINDMGASDSDTSVVDDGGDVHSVREEVLYELVDANSSLRSHFLLNLVFPSGPYLGFPLRLLTLLLVAWTQTKSNKTFRWMLYLISLILFPQKRPWSLALPNLR
jgi:hypothetical protein